MKQEEYNTFKQQIIDVAISEFKACEHFTDCISKTTNLVELKKCLRNQREEIFERLGGDMNDLEQEISDLEDKVDDLEQEIDELRFELEEATFKYSTMHGEMRYKLFLEYHSKYNPWEFEELLKNGKIG